MQAPSLAPVAEAGPSTPPTGSPRFEPLTPTDVALRALSGLNLKNTDAERPSGAEDDRSKSGPSSGACSPGGPLDRTGALGASSPGWHSPRDGSPFGRGHSRSRSTNSPAPPMVRAHSSPAYQTPSDVRSSSPLRSPGRVRSPFHMVTAESPSLVASPSAMYDIEAIAEDSELDLTPKAPQPVEKAWQLSPQTYLSPSPSPTPSPGASGLNSAAFSLNSSSFRLGRRRPASPLHQVSNVSFGSGSIANGTYFPLSSSSSASTGTTHGSPLLDPSKFNESFPPDHPFPLHHSRSFSSSSVPSTPTSARSRSPSISSLETIPDTPDAEAAAVEAERMERQRSASESGESGGRGPIRRGSLETPQRPGPGGFGWPGGALRDKRKRWSVCGAERRGDLDLETIWED